MGNDNNSNNNKTNNNSGQGLIFAVIIILLCVNLYYTVQAYHAASHPVNVGSLQHYDSIYSRETGNISINEYGDVTGYHTPDGLYYIFEEPIPGDQF